MAFTFFFRDKHTLEQLSKIFIPAVDGYSRIKIWDAGCAMGPEPFTFAIIIREAMGKFAFRKVKILASDIDETGNFEQIINNATFPVSDLQRMPENIFETYFHNSDEIGQYTLNDEIKNSVIFKKHNLLTYKEPEGNFNVILCKNVLLHFDYGQRIEVLKMFHRALAPNGFFAMEQTQIIPEESLTLFEKVSGDANIYRKK